jgi:phage gp46-like protein
MVVDVALAYDPARKCCDVVFNGRDFALDATPASAMLFSICARRRARPDDVVPVQVPDWANPASFNARGGWVGDALDPSGNLVGSRMWLLGRALLGDGANPNDISDRTRVDAENYLAECLEWLETVRGLAVQIVVRVLRPNFLGYRVRAGATTIEIAKALGS